MQRVTVYLKLRVIGAIDSMVGSSIKSRIREVSKLTFHDEDGVPHVFTWRTIQTWLSIYKQLGTQALVSATRPSRSAANLMSIIATCKRAKVEPFAYLCDVFRRLPAAKSPKQVRALLPDVWKPA
ncbi:MAG: transposase domain-containing protein [bacterium]